MGIFNLFKKPKSDLEQYYEERYKYKENTSHSSFTNFEETSSFRIIVEDIFSITGKGIVITGNIETGSVSVGEEVILWRMNGTTKSVVVIGIEVFRKQLTTAHKGDNVGIFLRGINRNEISRGDLLVK